MKKFNNYFLLFILFTVFSCQQPTDKKKTVLIETKYGNITVNLYDETPLHRDNFLKLVEKGFYDSLLFHRVIKNFVVQGGDPDSKIAQVGQLLGNGDIGTVPAEFRDNIFHKRGVLAAARENDIINPKQESSGCQFYFVQGKIYNDSMLEAVEKKMMRYKAYNRVSNNPENKMLAAEYKKNSDSKQEDRLKVLDVIIDSLVKVELKNTPPITISEERRKIYKSMGGIPHLDGSYTIFGEVTEGMEVVDKIASLPTDSNDRPVQDIRMKMKVLK